jgi:hypothetical protein
MRYFAKAGSIGMVLLICFSSFVSAQTIDSLTLSQRIANPIQKYIRTGKNEAYAICGFDSSIVVRVRRKQIVTISDKTGLGHSVHFTSILFINQNLLLLGTSNDYLYCIRNNRSMQLNRLHGLADSSITALEWDKDNKMILVSTNSARYLLVSDQNRFTLKKIDGAFAVNNNNISILTLIKKYFRRPIQKAICNSVSNIDLSGRKQKYITNRELLIIKKQLKPGDILLKHNDSQLINIGIPGIWSHAAIYLGGEKEINDYFKNIEMLGTIKPFDYIRYHFPKIVYKMLYKNHLIIEAIGEGVVINALQHCASVDCFAALRTQFDRQTLFQCIIDALGNYGKPYDFLFDFNSNDALVCSELVYNSFTSNRYKKAIDFNLSSLYGKPFLSPNDIAKQFCTEQTNQKPSFTLVLFYNGNKTVKKAYLQDCAEFCNRTY